MPMYVPDCLIGRGLQQSRSDNIGTRNFKRPRQPNFATLYQIVAMSHLPIQYLANHP